MAQCIARAGVEVQAVNTDGTIEGIDLEPADLIIGADGIDSKLRQQLWPSHPGPIYSGFTAWRGVCSYDGHVDIGGTLGRGAEAGIVPLTDGRIYWYTSKVERPGLSHSDEKAFVLAEFGTWHEPIAAVIEATPAEGVLHHDINFLGTPLESYVSGRVGLLGDAAHAMTPHLGQGACQALEDAAVLKWAAERFNSPAEMLAGYDRQRRPRSQAVAKLSRQTGSITSGVTNPVLVGLRDAVMWAAPQRVSMRAIARVADWSPPV